MKNIFLSILILLCSLNGFTQISERIEITWNSTPIYIDTQSINIPNFNSQNFYFNNQDNSILYQQKLKTNQPINTKTAKIKNIQYEALSSENIGVLNTSIIPNQAELEIENSYYNGQNFVFIQLTPIIKENGIFKKIISCTIEAEIEKSTISFDRNAQNYIGIQNSIFQQGDWYKFFVQKSGVYKITRSFLQSLGLNTNVDPRNIKIFGNGGRILPLSNSINYPIDPEEIAIFIQGENDGTFDNDDYILFYAEGTDQWSSENETNLNIYDDNSYYYITVDQSPGKRITPLAEPTQASEHTITTYHAYQFHERDLTNIGRLGRKWFGESFSSQSTQSFEFQFPNINTEEPARLHLVVASDSPNASSMTLRLNNQFLHTMNIQATYNDGPLFNESTYNQNITPSNSLQVSLTYNTNGVPSARGYLNYINVTALCNLTGHSKQFAFQNNSLNNVQGIGEFVLSNAQSIDAVWDITDRFNATYKKNSQNETFRFKATLGEVRKYIAIDLNDTYIPLRDNRTRVANQNLKGTIFSPNGTFEDIDYLIITSTQFKSEAQRLANFHKNNSNMNVRVVELPLIYTEFGSGKQDISAIRNFIRYVYLNASTPEKRVKYVNLFGDASFDFKDRIQNNTNIVPIFHSLYSASTLTTISTDDFFGMMDENEGTMNSGSHTLDIAVGRMLLSNASQAKEQVDKIIDYHSPQAYGRWRNNFTLISDDVDVAYENVLQSRLNLLGDRISLLKPNTNVFKIHSDAYQQESSAGGQRYPKVREEIMRHFENGTLVFNYFGHGGEDLLASERIFDKTNAQSLKNKYKYPLFITITCEFTRFDNPLRPTAGEYTYWNPEGGAISLISTTRKILVTTGLDVTDLLAEHLFEFNTNDDITIAQALQRTKNQYPGQLLMVSYLGDPALKLSKPKPKVILTHINDETIDESDFIFEALTPVKLSGAVVDEQNEQILTSFNGDIAIQIFDKDIERSTLGNDGTRSSNGQLIILNFKTLGETIFRGNASVNNGLFEVNFVVPKDISMPVGEGRISFYAKNNQALNDKSGYNNAIRIGGINANAAQDNTSPTVKLYMNDESFVDGGYTNQNPIFLAFLEDENGINTTSGIGHDIVAILDGDEANPYVLNDYYETETDNFRKGKVAFPFRNLTPGLHTITFRAWDVYNNPVTAELQFIVTGDDSLMLTNVLNYPNPFVNYTQFWFTHNRPFEPLETQVQIMTITGKVIKTIQQTITTEGFLSREISWDGRDDFGDKIGKGVYIYKLTVRSNTSNKTAEKIEKIVIL